MEPSSPSRDVGDGVGGVEMATEEPRGASPEAEVQHEARAAFADPYQGTHALLLELLRCIWRGVSC